MKIQLSLSLKNNAAGATTTRFPVIYLINTLILEEKPNNLRCKCLDGAISQINDEVLAYFIRIGLRKKKRSQLAALFPTTLFAFTTTYISSVYRQ
jgi:hypothetical protein